MDQTNAVNHTCSDHKGKKSFFGGFFNRTECLVLAQSGHSSLGGFMSAFGGKADMEFAAQNVCL
jgi:hypothetical protein